MWYSTELPEAELKRLATADDPSTAGDAAVQRERNATVVFIALVDGVPVAATAWRGLFGSQTLFYSKLPSGRWLLTDHFHNAVAALPEAERHMSDGALLSHYVGAAVYGRATYARGVERLAFGDRLDIDLASGELTVGIFSRHTNIATDEPLPVHLDRLDAALEDVIGQLGSIPDLGVGFSGGVDSTLLLSYLGNRGIPLTLVPGSPEFDAETEYAREASRLLGRDITEIRLEESDYRHHLENTIETVGCPVDSYVVPVLARLYEYDAPVFMIGEGADSVFGSGRGIRRLASLLSGGLGRSLLRRLEGDGRLGRRATQLGQYAALFAEGPLSPHGYAGTQLDYFGDMSGTLRIFGEEAHAVLNRAMLQEVLDRVELETTEDDGFFRHIEMAQWRLAFAELTMFGNHDAQAIGKLQVQPYLSWRIVAELLKVPARARYYKGLTGKWMLKELLARRVKGYRVNRRKLATALPFERYVEHGPLTGIWDHYEIPDVIPKELQFEVHNAATPLTWKAITHAIWLDRVVANPDLEPHPGVLQEVWPAPTMR